GERVPGARRQRALQPGDAGGFERQGLCVDARRRPLRRAGRARRGERRRRPFPGRRRRREEAVSVVARAKPSAVRWLVVAPLWAGVLGAGIFIAALMLVLALKKDRLLPGPEEVWVIFVSVAAIGIALFRGYDTPVRSYPALVGRLVG